MYRLLYPLIIAAFLNMTNAIELRAEEIDSIRSDVEVYGSVQFLLRIKEDAKFSVHIYDEDGEEEDEECEIDNEKVQDVLSDVLKKNNRLGNGENGIDKFRVDVDYYGGLDRNNHCILSYELYLTRNLPSKSAFTEIVEELYDYENSNPILKINGILHVSSQNLNEEFQNEVRETAVDLLNALDKLQTELNKSASTQKSPRE